MLFTRVRLLEEQKKKKTPKLLHGPEQWLAHSVIMYLHQNLIPLWVLRGLWSPPNPFLQQKLWSSPLWNVP